MLSLNLFSNGGLNGLLTDLSGQLVIVSVIGLIAVLLLTRKSAPLRSLAAAGTLLSLFGVFILSVAFHASDITWYNADFSSFAVKTPEPTPSPVAASASDIAPSDYPAPQPELRMENSFLAEPTPKVVVAAKPVKTFKLKAVHCINVLALIWTCGIIFMLLKLAYGLAFIRGFCSGLNRISDARINHLLKLAAGTFNKQHLPEIYTSPKVESPITIGLFNPIIIIPEKLFSTLSENELKSILLHELAHIYHCDHIIGVLKRISVAVNWWNPLAYIISKKHAIAREEVADNYVLRELSPKVYSQCLAGLAEKICLISSYPAAAGMAGNYSSLEQRVRKILSKKRQLNMNTSISLKLSILAICSTLTMAIAGCHYGAAKPAPALTPEQIIAKMAETYAKCKTYQDSGTVKTIFFQDTGERVEEKPFTTAFVRPDLFRFEYKEKVDSFLKEKPCYIVWRKGDEVLTWFYATNPNIVTKATSLSFGLAGATGVSSGSAHTIPALLLSEAGGSKLSDLKETKLLEDGSFDNSKCFRVQGKFIYKNDNANVIRKPTTIWIDKNTLLVRKIDEENVFSYFRTEVTTTYYPVINKDIPGSALEFNPPGGNKMLKNIKPAEKSPELSLKSVKANSLHDKKEASRLSMIGYGLSAKQVAELEQKLLKNPDDVNTITILLGYWNHIYRGDEMARQKRDKYILWMIEHHPDAMLFDTYNVMLDRKSKTTINAAKKLWIEQTGKYPNNAQVFWNAGMSLYSIDKPLVEQFFIKGQSLDPENPKWAQRLGNIYFWGKQPEKALDEYKKAYPKLTNDSSRFFVISRMATSAFALGKIQEAGEHAQEMQRLAKTLGNKNENYTLLMFNSNLILGRIASKQGKTGEAGKYLLEAGKAPASFKQGIDFTLPKDLLKAGQKDTVIQFLHSCSQFWDKTPCDDWIKQINDGKIPSFKAENSKVKETKSVVTQPATVQTTNSVDKKPEPVKPETDQTKKPESAGKLANKSSNISAAEAAELEQKIAKNPDDIKSGTMLLGYYFLKSNSDKDIRQKREKYILWLMKNHPEEDILDNPYGQIRDGDNYPAAKKLWLEQLEKHPDNLKIVGNFARFINGEDTDLAIKYYKKAKSHDPDHSYYWDFWLGSAYDLKSKWPNHPNRKQDDPETTKKALSYAATAMGFYESAFAHSPQKEKSG
ncbi:MAG: M56 family metallopeptidase, partial [Victivallaceae bacterium]